MYRRILVIAAHPDDEILGVGGTAARLSEEGNEVNCLILGEGATSRAAKREAASGEEVDALHSNTLEAAKQIGYNAVIFENLPDNRFDSVDLLDIVKIVEKNIEKFHPHVVYTHYANDLNIDHRLCFNAVLTATRPVTDTSPREIYAFETLSSTEWSFGSAFCPNVFVDVSGQVEKKLEAMRHYTSELRESPHPRSLEIIETSMKRWGSVIGVSYAEAFQLIRSIV